MPSRWIFTRSRIPSAQPAVSIFGFRSIVLRVFDAGRQHRLIRQVAFAMAQESENVVFDGPSTRLRAVFALGGMLLVSAYAIAISLPAAGIFHDDGIYVVTARALAEGQGYRIISLPESPPQTKYPILFPWLLSLVWRLAPSFPDNLLCLR